MKSLTRHTLHINPRYRLDASQSNLEHNVYHRFSYKYLGRSARGKGAREKSEDREKRNQGRWTNRQETHIKNVNLWTTRFSQLLVSAPKKRREDRPNAKRSFHPVTPSEEISPVENRTSDPPIHANRSALGACISPIVVLTEGVLV